MNSLEILKFQSTKFFINPDFKSDNIFFLSICRTLRKLFRIDAADYMISICGNDALRELSSPGKSGSFFYLTHDDRYMIKTMKKSEVKVCFPRCLHNMSDEVPHISAILLIIYRSRNQSSNHKVHVNNLLLSNLTTCPQMFN